MRCRSVSTRLNGTGGFANSASAMIALVAVAALMTSMPTLAHMRSATVEARSTILETQSVRAVAEAVAAVARELGGGDRVLPKANAAVFALALDEQPVWQSSPQLDSRDVHELMRSRVVSVRVLDLPPPVC